MEGLAIVAVVVAIPVILFPAAFVWYLNVGGIMASVKEARKQAAVQKAEMKAD